MLCAFASQKHYMSFYLDPEILQQHKELFHGLRLGKSCIRFKKLEQLSLGTIEQILADSVRRAKRE